jgi:transcriptional regulator with XRE-family HTH domain
MFNSSAQLKKLRAFLNLTQDEFADKINTKRNSISMIESGRNKPTFEMVADICRAFNISADYFLSDVNPDKNLFIHVNADVEKVNNINSDNYSSNNKNLSEAEFLNLAQERAERIHKLYQRLVDIRILLFQELKIKVNLTSQVETDLLHSLATFSIDTIDDEAVVSYPYENLDSEGKELYLQKTEECITLFTNTFFEHFRQFYKAMVIPFDASTRKKFLTDREKITDQWKYPHVVK